MIEYINRETGKVEVEKVPGEKGLKWVYQTPIGMGALELFVKKKVFSYLYGKFQDSKFSKRKILNFIREYNISENEFHKSVDSFNSFNEFFVRTLKKDVRKIGEASDELVSPADGKILAYQNMNGTKVFQVKGVEYSLEELLLDKGLAHKYEMGTCVIVRLCPADYHRFHFPDSGIPTQSVNIKGHYYSVNPIALKEIVGLYCRNKREVTMFNSENFGDICLIEVGATCVGSIIQTYEPFSRVNKGDEKGYFKFGGSTVMMLIEKNKVTIDEDIIKNTKNGLETTVKMGMRIGVKSL